MIAFDAVLPTSIHQGLYAKDICPQEDARIFNGAVHMRFRRKVDDIIRVVLGDQLRHQFLVAASGAFEVVLDDGMNKRTVTLNRPYYGLHIPPGIWAAEQGFSSGSVCLALASDGYDADDYIRDYDEFLKYRKQ